MATVYTGGGRELPARRNYICADCGGTIPKGTLYFNYTADSPSDGNVGHWQGRRHLDCNFPWHLPTETSPTKKLEGLRHGKTQKFSHGFSTVCSSSPLAGNQIWKLPPTSLLAIMIGQQPEALQSELHDEIAMGFQSLAAAYLAAAGDPREMREVGKGVRQFLALGPKKPAERK